MENMREPTALAHPPPGGLRAQATATGLASHLGSIFCPTSEVFVMRNVYCLSDASVWVP